jgi:hypothetical protein
MEGNFCSKRFTQSQEWAVLGLAQLLAKQKGVGLTWTDDPYCSVELEKISNSELEFFRAPDVQESKEESWPTPPESPKEEVEDDNLHHLNCFCWRSKKCHLR